ncbi:putative condensin complex subunit 3 [Blattamonas nauphoetae]|uniref:Condensin complex subunit 3 n=1 Tax=Blattamonas nauphoetae TaxID=2049346 RepID=A0ABQ9WUZ5_9EUKA|nr:putative condensin complex subunit 3 [Blattamonas nauphoetae]
MIASCCTSFKSTATIKLPDHPLPDKSVQTAFREYQLQYSQTILQYLTDCMRANDRAVRQHSIQLIGEILQRLSEECEFSSELLDEAQDVLIERTTDTVPAVRSAAAFALHRLQAPELGKDCPVTQALLNLLCDDEVEVRKTALSHIAPHSYTIPFMIDRLNDSKAVVRLHCLKCISARINIDLLQPNHISFILIRCLSSNEDDLVCECSKMICTSWLKQKQQNPSLVLDIIAKSYADLKARRMLYFEKKRADGEAVDEEELEEDVSQADVKGIDPSWLLFFSDPEAPSKKQDKSKTTTRKRMKREDANDDEDVPQDDDPLFDNIPSAALVASVELHVEETAFILAHFSLSNPSSVTIDLNRNKMTLGSMMFWRWLVVVLLNENVSNKRKKHRLLKKEDEEDREALLSQLQIPLSPLCTMIVEMMNEYDQLELYQRTGDRLICPLQTEIKANEREMRKAEMDRMLSSDEVVQSVIPPASETLCAFLTPQTLHAILLPSLITNGLRLIPLLDFTDEAGRRTAVSVLRNLLSSSSIHLSFIPHLIRCLSCSTDSIDDLLTMTSSITFQLLSNTKKRQTELSEQEMEEHTYSKTRALLHVLTITSSLLHIHRRSFPAPSLTSFLQSIILPLLSHPTPIIRAHSLTALSQICLIGRGHANERIGLIVYAAQNDVPPVSTIALNALVDIVLLYDMSILNKDDLTDKEWSGLDGVRTEPSEEYALISEAAFHGLPKILRNVSLLAIPNRKIKNETMTQPLLESFESAVEGLIKLLAANRILLATPTSQLSKTEQKQTRFVELDRMGSHGLGSQYPGTDEHVPATQNFLDQLIIENKPQEDHTGCSFEGYTALLSQLIFNQFHPVTTPLEKLRQVLSMGMIILIKRATSTYQADVKRLSNLYTQSQKPNFHISETQKEKALQLFGGHFVSMSGESPLLPVFPELNDETELDPTLRSFRWLNDPLEAIIDAFTRVIVLIHISTVPSAVLEPVLSYIIHVLNDKALSRRIVKEEEEGMNIEFPTPHERLFHRLLMVVCTKNWSEKDDPEFFSDDERDGTRKNLVWASLWRMIVTHHKNFNLSNVGQTVSRFKKMTQEGEDLRALTPQLLFYSEIIIMLQTINKSVHFSPSFNQNMRDLMDALELPSLSESETAVGFLGSFVGFFNTRSENLVRLAHGLEVPDDSEDLLSRQFFHLYHTHVQNCSELVEGWVDDQQAREIGGVVSPPPTRISPPKAETRSATGRVKRSQPASRRKKAKKESSSESEVVVSSSKDSSNDDDAPVTPQPRPKRKQRANLAERLLAPDTDEEEDDETEPAPLHVSPPRKPKATGFRSGIAEIFSPPPDSDDDLPFDVTQLVLKHRRSIDLFETQTPDTQRSRLSEAYSSPITPSFQKPKTHIKGIGGTPPKSSPVVEKIPAKPKKKELSDAERKRKEREALQKKIAELLDDD